MSTARTPNARAFTEEQRRAIETRDVSIALSAGAGCGKTFVLTERYLAHFDARDPAALQPDDIGQLVAITFTERAAREMRDRIRKQCHERLTTCPEDDAPYWSELLRALDNARISTIHSFCASLLRSRAVEAGIDPQFAVLEEAQAETLLSESIDDEIRRQISARDETTFELAVRFNLNALREIVRSLVLRCTPADFATWLAISPDEQIARWQSWLVDLPPLLGRQLATGGHAQAVRHLLARHEPANKVMQARRAALTEALTKLQQGRTKGAALTGLVDAVEANARVVGGGGAKVWPSEEAYEAFKEAATKLRERVVQLRQLLAFDPVQARASAVVGGQLLALADRVRLAYDRRKDEFAALDFNDLLTGAHRLLTGPEHRQITEQLSAHITLLLVDEFQDTDAQQVELVQALCGPGLAQGKLFFVGDFKQSIYRFRGANPDVFRRLRDDTPPAGRQRLSRNFRSQPAILSFVNGLFWDDLGDEYEPLRPSRPQVSPEPAIEFLWAPAADEKESKVSLRRREADWIARRIRGLLDSNEAIVWDRDAAQAGRPAARPAKMGDFAILFRALTDVEAYEEALRRHEIDYYLVGGHAFYAQQEIFDVMNLLRALDSPADAVSLIGVLRSGFFSLTDETIFWLAQHSGGVYEGLAARRFPEQIPSDQQRRAAFAFETLERLRGLKDRLKVCELIEQALSLTGYDAALLNEFLGERKLANLLKLKEQARNFQRGEFLGLADFIAQLSEFVVRQPDEPLAATHSEHTDVVRLMSVHQAKGLEFPIVIVPDVNRPPYNPSGRVHFDPSLGPLVRGADDEDDDQPSILDLWRHVEKSEDAAETNRLLYVATTRAADYLLLSGGVAQPGEASGPWAQLLARRFDLTTGAFIGQLPAGEPVPRVKVTTTEPAARPADPHRQRRADIEQLIEHVAQAAQRAVAPAAVAPIAPRLDARRQYSFSRLAGTLRRRYERLDHGEAGDEPIDPRGLGTLVHAVLGGMDFLSPADCRPTVRRLAEQHLTDGAAEVDEAVQMVQRFAKSPRARSITTAKSDQAEIEFLLAWPPERPEIVLRGVIDRLYQDSEGHWHVLDFKTNRTTGKQLAKDAAPYEMQMLVYALATEQILGVAPASITLHFLRTGGEYAFAWDEDARRRVVRLVNDAIAALAKTSPGAAAAAV